MNELDEHLSSEFFPADAPSPGGAVWMLSFADLLSVLLTFFVMLYSTTAIQNEKWEQFLLSLKNRPHMIGKAPTIEAHLPDSVAVAPEAAGNDLDYLRTVLTEKAASFPEIARSRIIRTKTQLILSFPMDTFYKDDTYLARESQPVISSLASIFDLIKNHVDVAVVIPKGKKANDIALWQNRLLKANILAKEIVSYGYHHPVGAYSYLSEHQKDADTDLTKPRVDFIIRETANPGE